MFKSKQLLTLGFLFLFLVFLGGTLAHAKEVVLVTGASRGIGASIANRLAKQGYTVYAGVRKTSTRQNLQPTESLRPVLLDVTQEESVKAAVARILKEEGRIDVLVNNAGVQIYGALENVTIEEAKHAFEINYFGALRVAQAVLEPMRDRKKGRIIQIGSRSGFRPLPSLAIYADTKAALLSASQSMAVTLKPWNIKVSVIEPGPVLTELDANSPYGSRLARSKDPFWTIFQKVDLLAPKPGEALGPGAQKPEEIAELVQKVIETPEPVLRYQTTKAIQEQASRRAVDSTGTQDVQELTQLLFK